uniref:Uncharacterized protein n=1 Tax=viral metagenome TaxID=1070528 RepID=A0A6C0I512_9ZZZZ
MSDAFGAAYCLMSLITFEMVREGLGNFNVVPTMLTEIALDPVPTTLRK